MARRSLASVAANEAPPILDDWDAADQPAGTDATPEALPVHTRKPTKRVTERRKVRPSAVWFYGRRLTEHDAHEILEQLTPGAPHALRDEFWARLAREDVGAGEAGYALYERNRQQRKRGKTLWSPVGWFFAIDPQPAVGAKMRVKPSRVRTKVLHTDQLPDDPTPATSCDLDWLVAVLRLEDDPDLDPFLDQLVTLDVRKVEVRYLARQFARQVRDRFIARRATWALALLRRERAAEAGGHSHYVMPACGTQRVWGTKMTFDLAKFLTKQTQVYETHGDEYVVPCVCDNMPHKAHLWVNVVKAKAICYRCGVRHGDATGIVAQVGGMDVISAARLVRKDMGGVVAWGRMRKALHGEGRVAEATEPDVPVELPREFVAIRGDKDLPAYARKRGLTGRLARLHGMGVCHEGFFADRLIVPVFDERQVLRSFVARSMVGAEPKVLYPKGSKTGQVVFNGWLARTHDTLVITEGVFDALRAGENAVALFGKVATRQQVRVLAEYGERSKLVVLLDDDAKDEAWRLCAMLGRRGCDVSLARLPPGRHDPGECTTREIATAVRQAKKVGDRVGRLAWRLSHGV